MGRVNQHILDMYLSSEQQAEIERIAAYNKKAFFNPPSGQELRTAFSRSFGAEN